MITNLDKLKNKIKNKELFIGPGVEIADPMVMEIFCEAGFGFMWIEMEHSAIDKNIVNTLIMVAKGTGTPVFVRVPDNNPATVKPILEMGVAGIVFPLIKTVEDAELAVKSCKYPPNGIRGFGPRRSMRYGLMDKFEYIKNADSSIWVMLMIEHIDAVNNLDEILKIPGIGSLVIGPHDLSGSIGILGHVEDKKVIDLAKTVIKKAKTANIPVGVSIPYNIDDVKNWINRGVDFIGLGGDLNFLTLSAMNCMNSVNNLLKSIKKQI
jgi:2-keto-3-deoxy-L-rhamnonate aldolase RhmA